MATREAINAMTVGNGGREHAFGLTLQKTSDSLLGHQYFAPGNGGTARIGENLFNKSTNEPIAPTDIDALEEIASDPEYNIGLTIVGSEAPLAAGIVDRFKAKGLRILGPTKSAAQIETSKIWQHNLMVEEDIPCPEAIAFRQDEFEEVKKLIKESPVGYWISKADGLAAGKGVDTAFERALQIAGLKAWMIDGALGEAGRSVLLQKRVPGREFSAIALCDGTKYRLLPFAADHKAVFNGGKGPNTGGMGAYSPVPWAEQYRTQVEKEVIEPTLRGLARRGYPFRGFLYAGMSITALGLLVYEFNCRMGDPEAQVILPQIESNLLQHLLDCANGNFDPTTVRLTDMAAVCVVLTSGGYPGKYEVGKPIRGLDLVLKNNTAIIHAGTAVDKEHEYVTAGGRVLGVTGTGKTLEGARFRAYNAVENINFEGMHYRTDIADIKAEQV